MFKVLSVFLCSCISLFFSLVFFQAKLVSANYMCFVDLDGSGAIDQENEVAECEMFYKCPVEGYECNDQGKCIIPGEKKISGCIVLCSLRGKCVEVWGAGNNVIKYRVWWWHGRSGVGSIVVSNSCIRKYIGYGITLEIFPSGSKLRVNAYAWHVRRGKYLSYQDTTQILSCETLWGCPLANNMQCVNAELSEDTGVSGDGITTTELNRQDYEDDGRRDEKGRCLDQIYIFNGKASECLTVGVDTFFHNCCNECSDNIKKQIEEALTKGGTLDIDTKKTINLLVIQLTLKRCKSESVITSCYNKLGLCHYVGEYCKKKLDLGFVKTCLQKAKVYCCFNSKLARIVHEQGRRQLKTLNSWGDAQNPNCRGFTPEEFQMLDFSKIDLSEWYGDLQRKMEGIQQKVKTKAEQNFQKFEQNIKLR